MRFSHAIIALLCLSPLAAHADTVFDLNATLAQGMLINGSPFGGGTAIGTITFDTTTDTFTAASVTVSLAGTDYTLDEVYNEQFGDLGTYEIGLSNPTDNQVSLILLLPDAPSNSIAGFDGGQVESDSYYGGNPSFYWDGGSMADVSFGTLEPATPPKLPSPPASLSLPPACSA